MSVQSCVHRLSLKAVTPTENDATAGPARAEGRTRLDMVKWMAAFDAFAVVFHAVGALEWTSAMAHKRNCLQIACVFFLLLVVLRVAFLCVLIDR